jgi:hypothetical protein
MLKAGIIVGLIAFLFAVGVALLSPLCVPCLSLLLGLGAGYLAGVFEKPEEGNETLKIGAIAGVIGGIGMALGQVIGAVINSIIVGPERAAQILESFGLQTGGQTAIGSSYWIGIIGGTVCFGLLDIAFMAGFGVLGALAWGKFQRKNSGSSPEVVME